MGTAKEVISLIENNQEKFYRVAFAYVKNKDDALDIVHNAIVKALEKRHTLRNEDYIQTWFYRILINESINFLHRRGKILYLDTLPDSEVSSGSNTKSEEYIDLYSAIDRLPPKLKTIIILRYFEDMQLDTIAKITSTNLSTTKSRLYKALEIMKVSLEDI